MRIFLKVAIRLLFFKSMSIKHSNLMKILQNRTIRYVRDMLFVISITFTTWPVGAENIPSEKLLFIGNSLTYGNSLPTMLEAMSRSDDNENRRLEVEMVTIGWGTLQQHWFEGRALAAIERGGWDYVVLQEYSTLGPTLINGKRRISQPQTFHAYVTLFDQAIRRSGARTLLYLTWANEDTPADQPALNRAYVSIAHELGAKVIPVGPVWQQVQQALPALPLYLDDKLHPTAAGSYVAAAVFYAHLFGESILGQSASIEARVLDNRGETRSPDKQLLVELPRDQARQIQQLALQSRDKLPGWLQRVAAQTPPQSQPPKLPESSTKTPDISGSWVGQLQFFKDRHAQLTLNITRQGQQWQVEQIVLLDNDDRIHITRPLWLSEAGEISWSDPLLQVTYTGVYQAGHWLGQVRSWRKGYGESGGRFGEWEVVRKLGVPPQVGFSPP